MKIKSKWLIILVVIIMFLALFLHFDYLGSVLKSVVVRNAVEDIPGVATEDTYPVILLHGFNPIHSERIAEFLLKDMQSSLAKDLGYLDKGLYTEQITCAELRYGHTPIIIRGTYLDSFQYEIEDYAKNVDQMIAKVLNCTGAKKVDLVVHSMGGIVVRYYLQNIDSDSIRKLVMLSTPNKGGLYGVGKVADEIVENGVEVQFDFLQLSENSSFMKKLNSNGLIENVEYFTIAGNIDGRGDGLVLKDYVALNENHQEVNCNHISIKNPTFCEEAYVGVKEVLEK